jgi:hypothetical protein
MKRIKTVSIIIGIVQFILGAGILFIPRLFFKAMGFTEPSPDNIYMFGMLAARFIAYGAGMLYIARDPMANRFWILTMILIQAIDLGVGLFYTLTGAVSISSSGLAMFNATVFIILLSIWFPRKKTGAAVNN